MDRVFRYEGPNRGPFGADDQVAFPMAGQGSVVGLSGTLADNDRGGDVTLWLVPGSGAWDPQRSTRRADRAPS